MKGENLMVFPSTAEGFRDANRTLSSLHGNEGVSFHTVRLPEYCCVWLLNMNLGEGYA
jgi:hypothetical protein